MPRQRNQSIIKTHYKAYKAGKRWLFAAISTAAFAGAVGFSNPHVTFADTLSESTSQTVEPQLPASITDPAAGETQASVSDSTDSPADGTTDATTESDDITTPPTPAPNPVSDSNTQALAASAKALDDQVKAAKANHVSVTETAPTINQATPENLSEQTASVVTANETTQASITDASNIQAANNEAYQTEKADYDNQTVTIASTNKEWTDAEIVHLLADEGGESDVSEATEFTDEQRLAASDQVKRAASVTFNKGATVTNVDGTPLASLELQIRPDAMPAWKYNNAFTDPATGRSINVVETITDYKVATNANKDNGNYVEITNNQIGFTPHFVENITADVAYFYADTGEAATLDVILGFADMDGHQGVTVNNGFANLIKGSRIGNVDGVYRDADPRIQGYGTAPSDAITQIWVLQRGVTHTSYTFYVGFLADGIGVDNFQPIQYIGGAAFSTKLPIAPTLKSEKVSYSPNQLVVTTQATIQYTGAGDLTPKPGVVPVTYTGDFDSTTQTWTWKPDTDTIKITAPRVEGYTLDPSADTLALQPLTVDPTDQTYVLHYSQNPLLTVHYLDEAGNQVKSDTTQTGAIGANYSVSAPSRIGNFALNDPQPQTGQYIPGDQSLTFTYSPAKTLLTTHYVDENNHQLQADTTQTGNSGDPFTLDAPPIDGYTLLGKNVSTGVYTGETMAVTFHYVQIGKVGENQATGLTVHYVNQDGNKINQDAKHSSALGTNFKVTAKHIPDYTIIGKTEYTGKFVGNAMDITFTYAKRGTVGNHLKTDLTVHYVDQDGNQIDEDAEHSGPLGTNFKVTAKHIPNYTIIGKTEHTGKLVGNTMDITFTYAKRGTVGNHSKSDLTVHYVDQDGNKITEDDTQSGDLNTGFDVTAKHIPNYTIIGKAEYAGKFVGNAMDITFTYAKRGVVGNHLKTDLTVHYVDQDGNKIDQDDTQSGDMDTDFKVTAKHIPDYTIIRKTEYTGKFVGNTMDITFTYAKRGTVGNNLKTDLTVHYVDQDGNKIDQDAKHSSALGTNFKVTAKHIPDYTIIGKTEYTGKFVGNAMDITFTYAKRGTVGNHLKSDLTIHYVDQDGNKIDQDDTQSGDMDTDFDVTAKHIPNYTIIGKTKYTGKFVGNAMDITFVYAKRGTVGKNLKTDLTVHYVDQDGNQIDQDAEHSGPLSTNFKVTAKHISNYTIIGKTEYTGRFVGNTMDITFVYAKRGTVGKNLKTDLTVHYVDQDGNVIAEDSKQSGEIDSDFDITAKQIPGFTIIGKAEYADKYNGNTMDLTFTYAKRGVVGDHLKTDLTVHYVDQDGNVIAEDTKQPGEIDDTFDVIAKQIPGYTVIGKAEYSGKYVGDSMDLTFTYAKRGSVGNHLKTDLTVHYVDQDDNVIAEETKQPGEIGDTFDVIAKQIPGYTIIGKAEYAGKYDGNTMDLIFTYAKRGIVGNHLKTDLTVHYVGQDGIKIDDDDNQSGEVNTDFNITAKQIPGYTITGKTEYTGKYDGNLMDLTFTYAKRGSVGNHLKTDLTVHYVDQEGNVIAEDTKQSGTMDASFDITGKHISGYTILGKAEYIGKYIGNTMDITFTYAKRGAVGNHLMTDLTVQYVDQDGNTIADDSKQSGKIETDFDVNAKQIPGYMVIGKAEYAGKYVGNTMDITFTYAKRGTVGNHLKTDLTVHYVDQDGNTIAEDTTQSGDIDSVFEVQAKQIPNYTIIGTSEYAGTYVGNTMDITFTYAKRGVVGNHHKTDLIVHYVDQDGNPIAPDAVQSGTIGTAFNLDATEIPGYTITSPSTATGTYQGNTMAYTFMYRQASQLTNTKQTLLIKRFVNEKGETIRPDISLSGPTGYTYLTMAQPIAGYTLLGKYAQTGTYQGDVMTLTFVYRQIINDSGTPDTNVTPGVNDPDLEVTPSDETTPTSNPNPTIDTNPGTETVTDIPTQPTNETVPTPDTQPNDVTHPVIEPTPTVDSKPSDESAPITDPNPAIETTPTTEIEPHHIDNPEVNLNALTESKPNHDTLPATNPDDSETPDRNPISDYSDHGKANTDTPIPDLPDTSAQPTRSTLPNTDVTSAPQLTSVTTNIQSTAQTGIQTTATRSAKTLPETGDAKQSLFLIAGMSLMTLFATGLAATRKHHHAD